MDNQSTRSWSSIHGLKVMVVGERRTVGTVEDFYSHSETNEVYSLKVHTRVSGDFYLPPRMICSIEQDAVTIPNEEMLGREPPRLLPGHAIVGSTVVDESGKQIGVVRNVFLGIVPVAALRVAALEVVSNSGRAKLINASSVSRYEERVVVIYDQVA
jgi:sporulation protein YlmC with PRC-barrel domain